MSIPKEPRQLMINLMYLVLTALLALNVSAEVMNAFFSLDKGLEGSRKIVDKNNIGLMKSINTQADAYKNPQNESYRKAAMEAQQIATEFEEYVGLVRSDLWQKAGGDNAKIPGQPKDIRNKDLTTRWFIKEGKGAEIKSKIEETRIKLLALVTDAKDKAEIEGQLTLGIEEIPPGVKAKTWEEFKFKQMPVAAVIPTLGKLQSDVKSSATAVLNYLAKKVGGTEIKMDAFEPAVSAPKGYVILGEKYEADVFLSAYSTTANNVSISAGGRGLSVVGGKAHFEESASSNGIRKYNVSINVTNPLTKEVKNYQKEFSYEVGQRSVACAADKMNVFYIGVDNPLSVSAAGVNSNDVKVSASGCSVNKSGAGKFIVTATTPTSDASITVSAPGVTQKFPFRVKRIPDPTPLLGAKHKSGSMGNGEFKAQGGIAGVLENFDFDVRCSVVGFKAVFLAKRQDPVEYTNSGAKWGGDVQGLINKAKPGDTYFFDDIKVSCPGDAAGRNLGGLSFKIK
jgi:gliding motility-associated protein GldM